MRKVITFLFALLLMLPAAAMASDDLAAMSTDHLRTLRDAINLELATRSQTDTALAEWETACARVELVSVTRGTADDGAHGVALVLAYTNTGTEIDNFRAAHWVTLYQDGVEQNSTTRLDGTLVDADSWSKKVQPGARLEMQWFFLLSGDTPTIDVEIEDRSVRPYKSAGLATIALP